MVSVLIKYLKIIIVYLKIRINSWYFSLASNQSACAIKEFDLKAKEVIIYCYGVRIITIRSSIAEIIGDSTIILNLPSYQSCWLGYYYGKLCAQSSYDAAFFHARGGRFLLRFTKGRFKIFSFDRENMLTYIDVKTNISYRESPLSIIAQDTFAINQFDSTQACYIGILAGLMVAKQGEDIIQINKKPIFTVIK